MRRPHLALQKAERNTCIIFLRIKSYRTPIRSVLQRLATFYTVCASVAALDVHAAFIGSTLTYFLANQIGLGVSARTLTN